jgi:DNA-binding CsgD family transcriptional regulator
MTLDALCQVIALMPVTEYPPKGVGAFNLNADATYSLIATFGYPPKFTKKWQNSSLLKPTPLTHVMRTKKPLFIATEAELLTQFSIKKEVEYSEYRNNILMLPITKNGLVIGGLMIVGFEQRPTEEAIDYYQLIASMFGRRMGDNLHSRIEISMGSRNSLIGIPLTSREGLIQVMMHDGKTNLEISNELGYSESTVRQDAVSMFGKLDVKNRKEAGDLLNPV